jgi:hypothetical protein
LWVKPKAHPGRALWLDSTLNSNEYNRGERNVCQGETLQLIAQILNYGTKSFITAVPGRYDTHHNVIQPNGTQQNDIQRNI